jgi:hypothetical protein
MEPGFAARNPYRSQRRGEQYEKNLFLLRPFSFPPRVSLGAVLGRGLAQIEGLRVGTRLEF